MKCDHEEWCNNVAKFTVDGKRTCSVHLASACRFGLGIRSLTSEVAKPVEVNSYG